RRVPRRPRAARARAPRRAPRPLRRRIRRGEARAIHRRLLRPGGDHRRPSSTASDAWDLPPRPPPAGPPAAAASYAERFARIMVDEFQDTNPLQLEILRFLERDHVFTVRAETQHIQRYH